MAKSKFRIEPPAPPPESVMYVGPSKLGLLHVQEGTVFKAGLLPEQIKAKVAESPDFARLFVPMSRAGAARAQIKNPTSPLAKAFAAVAQMEV